MIDLAKLEARFDEFFERETEETFATWLQEKQKQEILSLLGSGKIEDIIGRLEAGEFKASPMQTPNVFPCVPEQTEDCQFAMAA